MALCQWFKERLWHLWFAPAAQPLTGPDRLLRALFSPIAHALEPLVRQRYLRRRSLPTPPVPVVVVGNLLVGGTGKTPIVASLARTLTKPGKVVGILSRGYGRQSQTTTVLDNRSAQWPGAQDIGDEPYWLAQTLAADAVPAIIGVGADRAQVLREMLRRYPEVSWVISDDGLQHEHLPRTLELVNFDERGLGNGRLLPAGPLREPLELARQAHAWLWRAPQQPLAPDQARQPPEFIRELPHHPPCFEVLTDTLGLRPLAPQRYQALEGADPAGTQWQAALAALAPGEHALAVAGIAQPQNFLHRLSAFTKMPASHFQLHPLADHASAQALEQWFDTLPKTSRPDARPLIFTTAKDAVKLSARMIDQADWFVLDIAAQLPQELVSLVAEHLQTFRAQRPTLAQPMKA